MKNLKNKQAERRKMRVRLKLKKKLDVPRLSVYRSNRYLYAQVIDDTKKTTLVSVGEKELEGENKSPPKLKRSHALGVLLAQKCLKRKIEHVVLDRGSYRYAGRLMAFAEGVRKGGVRI